MATPHPSSDSPLVSVIVPARNEEASLAQCLESLVSQTGVSFEIVVVDDASTDRTRQIAESFSQVHTIDAPPLPPGWTGKNNALAAGAKAARGKWLLFTDADTVHHAGSLARSLEEAKERTPLCGWRGWQRLAGPGCHILDTNLRESTSARFLE